MNTYISETIAAGTIKFGNNMSYNCMTVKVILKFVYAHFRRLKSKKKAQFKTTLILLGLLTIFTTIPMISIT